MRSRSRGKTLFKLLGALAALVLIDYGLRERSDITDLQQHGKLATVAPPGQYTEFKQDGISFYTAEFHFKTQDGRDIVQKHAFPESVLADFKTGKPVQIIYSQNDPNTFMFTNETPGWTLVICGVCCSLRRLCSPKAMLPVDLWTKLAPNAWGHTCRMA